MSDAPASQVSGSKRRLLEVDSQKSQQDSMIIDMKHSFQNDEPLDLTKTLIKNSQESQQ